MSFTGALKIIVIGTPIGIVMVTTFPIFGAVGSISATGVAVGLVIGAIDGVADEMTK